MKPSQPIQIHQFHFHVGLGDAITQQMLFIQKSLKEIGIEGGIFANKIRHRSLLAENLSREKLWGGDLLLIHHSFGNPAFRDLLKIEIPKAIVYHNITPASYFKHDPHLYKLSLLGRNQLKALRKFSVRPFADSEYNAKELKELGFEEPRLLPLLDLEGVAPLSRPCKKAGEPLQLLFVGRISPHKNQALLIEIFHYLKRQLPAGSKMVLIGTGDRIYLEYLKLLRRELGLQHDVEIRGHVSDKEREQLYTTSDAFLCVSGHEGFCVPLVEAMIHSLPIFALAETGSAGTLQKAGVHLKSLDNPRGLAASIAAILASEATLAAILESQRNRLHELTHEQNRFRAQEALVQLIKEMREFPHHTMRTFSPATW